jgi:NitT/TauT family transport system permease protein
MGDVAYKFKDVAGAGEAVLSLPVAIPVKRRSLQVLPKGFLLGVPLLVFVALIWEIAPRVGLLNPIFIPPLSTVWHAWQQLAAGGSLARDVAASLRRSATGLLLAVIVAIPLGLLMGRYRRFESISDLFMQTLRNTPQYALLPLFVLIMGIGEASKIAITFYASMWMLLINTISGVKSVDPLLIKAAKSMGASEYDIFMDVVLPASIPSIASGSRLAVKASVVSVIGAEMLAAQSGLGHLIQNAQLMMQIPDMYAGILTLTAIGLIINYLLVWLEKKASGWKANREAWNF